MVCRPVARLALAALVAFGVGVGFTHQSSAQTAGTVTVNASLVRTLTLTILPTTALFGPVSPGGLGGLTDATTNNSYFLATGPIVTVITNSAWSGTIQGTDVATPETTLTIAAGSLRYTQATLAVTLPPVVSGLTPPLTYAAAAALNPITTAAQPWVASGSAGISNYAEIYALRVLTSDSIVNNSASGQFSATVRYSASN